MHNLIDNIFKYHKQLKFIAIGFLLFLIDFISTVSSYYVLQLSPGISSAIGFTASFVFGFSLNRKIVFVRNENSRFTLKIQIILYLMLALANLFLSALIVEYIVRNGVRIEIIKPLLVIMFAFCNYVIMNKYIFRINAKTPQ